MPGRRVRRNCPVAGRPATTPRSLGLLLDTSEQTPEETVAEIVARVVETVVDDASLREADDAR